MQNKILIFFLIILFLLSPLNCFKNKQRKNKSIHFYRFKTITEKSNIKSQEKTHAYTKEKKIQPEIHVRYEVPTRDVREQMRKLTDQRVQRQNIDDLESKINMDTQAFQQVTAMQNAQIQKLSELIQANRYHIIAKQVEEGVSKEEKEKQNNSREMIKRFNYLTDPFDFNQIQPAEETMLSLITKRPKYDNNRLQDDIYGYR